MVSAIRQVSIPLTVLLGALVLKEKTIPNKIILGTFISFWCDNHYDWRVTLVSNGFGLNHNSYWARPTAQ